MQLIGKYYITFLQSWETAHGQIWFSLNATSCEELLCYGNLRCSIFADNNDSRNDGTGRTAARQRLPVW
jgi:hypothetical protein